LVPGRSVVGRSGTDLHSTDLHSTDLHSTDLHGGVRLRVAQLARAASSASDMTRAPPL
jgi:uncharacterized protein YjbI with pentapeptide repeats